MDCYAVFGNTSLYLDMEWLNYRSYWYTLPRERKAIQCLVGLGTADEVLTHRPLVLLPLLQPIMTPLPAFPLSLSPDRPPPGYDWEERDMSVLSTTTARILAHQRDTFLGEPRCVIRVCGEDNSPTLRQCDILMDSEQETVVEDDV
jgi:hypothetical protein